MDKLQWFKFSPVDWLMGKIQRVPEITQIRFIRLVCLYWNKECILSIEDAEIEIDKEHLDMLVSKKIVKLFNGRVVIDFLDEQLDGIAGTREERKRAANIRWDNYRKGLQVDANALQNSNDAMQSYAEERREEKIDKKLLSKIEISDVELPLIEYYKIAVKFQNLFIKNLKEKGAPTKTQENAKFKSYVDPIRLMLELEECTIDQLRDVFIYLDSPQSEFWKKNILSTEKLRKQLTTLLMASKEHINNKPKVKEDRL